MKSNLSYYKGSAIFTAVCIALAWAFAGVNGAILALVLSVLETSVSLDNAVVNAAVLEKMDDTWRHRFLTWGMVTSVFFVRVLFPILIVWSTSSLNLVQSFALPFTDAAKYATTVQAAHLSIAGFGGAFLLMVAFAFFMDPEKEHHWIPGVERFFSWFGSAGPNPAFPALVLSILILGVTAGLIGGNEGRELAGAGVFGIIAWFAVKLLGHFLEGGDSTATKAALGTFIYLNVLDASFSFDGVVGAFAVSNNVIVITAGLSIGAMFVRSMTLHMVDKGTLGELKFLEHGAFWSIGTLAAMMFIGTMVHIPEIVTGLSAAVILAIAVVHSLIHNRKVQTATPVAA